MSKKDKKQDIDNQQKVDNEEEKINSEIARIVEENKDLTADIQRTRADFENYRKQVELRISDARKAEFNKTINIFLPIFDSLESGLKNVPEDIKNHKWSKGVEATYSKMLSILDKNDIKKIEVKQGDIFNPDIHNAIQFEDEGGDKEIVSEVLQNGYVLDGQVIRHAMVKVTTE